MASQKKNVKYLDVDDYYMSVDAVLKPGIKIMDTSQEGSGVTAVTMLGENAEILWELPLKQV